jgi:dUTP pyrophosphatase
MLIKYVKLYPDAEIPIRLTGGAVGFDVPAYHLLDAETKQSAGSLPAVIEPGGKLLIGTGIAFAVPFPVKCEVDPRSGLANKHGVELSNSPGTVDPDYRGEIGILLRNRSGEPYTVEKGDRVAQLTFMRVEIPVFVEVEMLPSTLRGAGGFGSTGYGKAPGEQEWLAQQRRMDRYFLDVAVSVAKLSNCLRGVERGQDGTYEKDADGRYCGAARRFGCVIVRDDNIIAQGYNVRDEIFCTEAEGCGRERENVPTGTSPEKGCEHAEGMALHHCMRSGAVTKGATAYVNAEPCLMCAKELAGAQIDAIVVPEGIYPNNGLKYLIAKGVEVRTVAK